MKWLDALWARPPEQRAAVLLGLALLLTAGQGARYAAARFQTTELQRTLAHMGETPRRAEAPHAQKYEDILKKGLLGQPPAEGGPPSELKLFGVLGGTALMGPAREGIQPYEVGKELPGGEKLVSVGTNSVVVEKDGKQRTLEVFDPANAAPPSGPGGPPPSPEPGPGAPPPPGAPPGMPGAPPG